MAVGDTRVKFDPLDPPRWGLRNPEGHLVDIGVGEAYARFARPRVERGYTLELLNNPKITVETVVEEYP